MNLSNKKIIIPRNTNVAEIKCLENLPIEETALHLNTETPKQEHVNTSNDEEHIKKILSRIHSEADTENKKLVADLLKEYNDIFAKPGEIGEINCYKHKIILLEGAIPVRKSPYRKPASLEQFEREKVKELLEKGVIRPSHSPWGCGVVIVLDGHRSKNDSSPSSSPRLAIDYRPLNKQVHKDSFPLPNINTVIDWIGRRSKFISTLDVARGFWSMLLDPESIPLTGFITQLGLFEFTRLPYGVCNGAAAYQRAMSIILCGLLWENVLAFIDDIFYS
ncbi:Retrovirus-related Pol polyprotein from transposon opus [Folsomia candida]|uniref:Retrovirus-related Pol polyprotein from transposon opus n=1 Tax=Folsomia candida TaxID=158441 RepID=A0A226D7R9_FOLCA|nr:Retrovirus-related Pol polyprotein from transposon opus [Folsomia candida]